jgi:hypothetical protein
VLTRFLIEPDGPGRYRYSLDSAAQTVLLSSAAIGSIDEARTSIERLRDRLRTDQWARRHGAADGSGFWFEIVDADGTLLATSIAYDSRFAREMAIERLQLDAHLAAVVMNTG